MNRVLKIKEELQRRRDPNCVPLLLDVLHDDSPLEWTALDLIAKLGDDRCIPFLVPLADKHLDADMNVEVFVGQRSDEYKCLSVRRTLYFLTHPDHKDSWYEAAVFAPQTPLEEIQRSVYYKKT